MTLRDLSKPLLFPLTALCCLAIGCGPPDYYSCKGVVMHEGKPVPHVQITFSPVNPDATRPPVALSDENGKFEMKHGRNKGVPPGSYHVHIEDPAEADGGQTSDEPGYVFVTDRYNPIKSDLKYEADQHRSDFVLDLPKTEYTGPEIKTEEIENTTDI